MREKSPYNVLFTPTIVVVYHKGKLKTSSRWIFRATFPSTFPSLPFFLHVVYFIKTRLPRSACATEAFEI